ncbi:noggin 5 precursor [Triplophysa rosa]|uniref:Noggin 5 n=1 Tax=Triplophysa rosa TaxID=992332 RepID=A0A9W7TUK2_TRIRA|nr:noggin 5 precursor [Triplophysa rosa]
MEMKVSPALVLCVSVTFHLALPQHQLRVRPLPSDHLPVPDLQEDPNPAFEPGERDLLPHFLRRKLGSSFDPLYSSIGPPTRGNGSEVTQEGIGVIGQMPREFHELDLAELNVGPKTQRRVRRWLWSYTRCSVLWVWKDLDVRFWPRYLKEGRMFCKPTESVSVSLLRWHCQGSRALKSCAWIRARYPVISRCGCAC